MVTLARYLALMVVAGFFVSGDASAEISTGKTDQVMPGQSDAATPLLEANRVRFKPG
jgi:hypothetical protein